MQILILCEEHQFNNLIFLTFRLCNGEDANIVQCEFFNRNCLRSERECEREKEYTHEFSIKALFLPYWDYIKGWNWGFHFSSLALQFLSCLSSEQYRNILWRKNSLEDEKKFKYGSFFPSMCGEQLRSFPSGEIGKKGK